MVWYFINLILDIQKRRCYLALLIFHTNLFYSSLSFKPNDLLGLQILDKEFTKNAIQVTKSVTANDLIEAR